MQARYRNVDVGLMQVNLRWHGNRVPVPDHLLDAQTDLAVAADILAQAEIAFGLKEPLLSWLRTASAEAVAALAGSPTLVYEPRLPEPALDRVVDAYEGTSMR